jgi:hypothetical protein
MVESKKQKSQNISVLFSKNIRNIPIHKLNQGLNSKCNISSIDY